MGAMGRLNVTYRENAASAVQHCDAACPQIITLYTILFIQLAMRQINIGRMVICQSNTLATPVATAAEIPISISKPKRTENWTRDTRIKHTSSSRDVVAVDAARYGAIRRSAARCGAARWLD